MNFKVSCRFFAKQHWEMGASLPKNKKHFLSFETNKLRRTPVHFGAVQTLHMRSHFSTLSLKDFHPFLTPVLTLLSSRKLWETLRDFYSPNLAIWTLQRILLEQTGVTSICPICFRFSARFSFIPSFPKLLIAS